MLFPIIVPRRYNKDGRWVGPMKNLRHPQLALTWVVLREPGAMTYISHEMALEYQQRGVDFESEALSNLQSAKDSELNTHHKVIDGRLIHAVAMHQDGLGSSRLLLVDRWKRIFPNGCYFGLPERSCAFIVPVGLSPRERRSVVKVVDHCHKYGTTTMLPGLQSPDLYVLE